MSLTELGYKAALKHTQVSAQTRPKSLVEKTTLKVESHFYGIHPQIITKCGALYETGAYAEAVEKSFKIVRDRLRELSGYETGSDAFGKGGLHIGGAAAPHVEEDFNQGVKFLTMAIDRFRNEKVHTADGNIADAVRAHQYLSLSSLALYFLENANQEN